MAYRSHSFADLCRTPDAVTGSGTLRGPELRPDWVSASNLQETLASMMFDHCNPIDL